MYPCVAGGPRAYHSMLRQDLNKKVNGQSIEILKNLKNIFLINNQHSLKSYQLGNIEFFSKEVD